MRLAAIPFWRWLYSPSQPPTSPTVLEAPAVDPAKEAVLEVPAAEPVTEEEAELAAEIERRLVFRFPCHREAWLHPVTLLKMNPWHAIVMDISTDGIGLAIERPVPLGTFFAVELPDPLTKVSRLLRARVIHLQRQAHNYWHIGCALTNRLSDEEVESLLL